MGKPVHPPAAEEGSPLYVRWTPDRSAYGIELRLDLVKKITAQVSLSEQLGAELGGFLIGSFPAAHVPTIRIEDIEMVSNGSDDDTVFLPQPDELERFPGTRAGHRAPESVVIGFFRTHARVGPMRPSLADRSIFAHEFQSNPYVVLLIQAQAPHTAAFFLARNGQLPQEPSVREFEFSEDEFNALPEVPAEAPEEETPAWRWRFDYFEQRKMGVYAKIAALVLLAIGACALMWSFARQAAGPGWFGSGNHLHLSLTPEDYLLRISWNQSASELNQATGARLIITDGVLRSEIQLGMDDLRLGTVEYQRSSSRVDVQMILNTPTGEMKGDSAEWSTQ